MSDSKLAIISGTHADAGVPALETISSNRLQWKGFLAEENHLAPAELPAIQTGYAMAGMVISPHVVKWNWRQNGRDYQADFCPENISTVPAGQVPQQWWKEPITLFTVSFEPEFLSAALQESNRGKTVELRLSPTGQDPVVAHLFWALRHELRMGLPAGHLVAESIGAALAAALSQKFSSESLAVHSYKNGLDERALGRIVEYIDQNLDKNLGLDELSKLALMSPFHLCRQFKRRTGQSVHQYVLSHRVARAKHLLSFSDLSLAEIAFRSGLPNQSHFTTVFRKLVGATPNEFRRSVRS